MKINDYDSNAVSLPISLSLITPQNSGEAAEYLSQKGEPDKLIGKILVHSFHDRNTNGESRQRLYTIMDRDADTYGLVVFLPAGGAHDHIGDHPGEHSVRCYGLEDNHTVNDLLEQNMYGHAVDPNNSAVLFE